MKTYKNLEQEIMEEFEKLKHLMDLDGQDEITIKSFLPVFVRTALQSYEKEVGVGKKGGNPELETNQDFGYNSAISEREEKIKGFWGEEK